MVLGGPPSPKEHGAGRGPRTTGSPHRGPPKKEEQIAEEGLFEKENIREDRKRNR